MKYSKVIVALVVGLNVAFAAAVMYVFLRTGAEPVALVGAWFAFTTAELWQLASIKKSKARGSNAGYQPTPPGAEASGACSGGEMQSPGD